MRQIFKVFLLSACLVISAGIMADDCGCNSSSSCCSTDCCNDCCVTTNDGCCNLCGGGFNHFAPRSQTWNTARGLVGWQEMIHRMNMEETYGAFAITAEYTRSFKPCRLTQFFFGPDLQSGKLVISGSRKGTTSNSSITGAVARNEKDWLADYFGLPTDFESTVCFTPRISNFLVDFDLFVGGRDNCFECYDGLWFRVHTPLVHSRWQLCLSESVTTTGVNDFAMGYMASTTILRSELPADFKTAMAGGKTWGDMQEGLKYDKIDNCTRTKTRLAEIHLEFGWDFWQCEESSMGLGLLVGLPVGNKPCPDYLFDPVVGNGGHFELGAVLYAHGGLWQCEEQESRLDLYLEGKAAHLFKRKQYRSFDLKDKPNSRFVLIQEMKTPADNLYASATYGGTYAASTYEYAGNLFPMINKTTCCTDVKIDVQGEATLKLAYGCNTECGRWNFDIGYNIWGRSGEKFCGGCDFERDKYALKGDAYIYGFAPSNATSATANDPYALAATESKSDINSGTNTPSGTAFALAHRLNPSIDNPQVPGVGAAGVDILMYTAPLLESEGGATRTSIQPRFIQPEDLDTSKTPSAVSHKIFLHFGFAWDNEEKDVCWAPFLGLGGEVEFSGQNCGTYSALSQWGIWLKGGVSWS